MPSYEEYDLTQGKKYAPAELDLLTREKSSGVSNMLAEAYEWGKENKVALGVTVGLLAMGGLGLRAISKTRANMAEMYGPGAESLSMKVTTSGMRELPTYTGSRFFAHDDAILGGRIGVQSAAPAADAVGQHALKAKLHEIPTFSEMPWDPTLDSARKVLGMGRR